MRLVVLLAMLLPLQAVAGAQYTADDVIRYFEHTDAAAAAAPSAAPAIAPTKGSDRGVGGGAPAGDAPLVIPLTGAKAGYSVAPGEPSVHPAGYDLLVTFEIESAVLTPQARENLDAFADALHSPALIGLRFVVEGHTDSSGAPGYNRELSEARAAAVVAYLVARGLAPDRLSAIGYGETRPRLADPGDPGNRRVETRRIR